MIARILCVLMLATVVVQAATINSLTNSPDPFNNRAAFPANIDTISVTLSAVDDLRVGIYNTTGTALYRRMYAGMPPATSVKGYWDGRSDALPNYASADTLAYGTYAIRAWSGHSTVHATTTKGSGLIIDDLFDVAVDKEGYIWSADQLKGVIQRVDTAGNLLTKIDISAPPLSISGFRISGLTVDDSLNIFFSDRGNNRITKLHASSQYTTATLTWNGSAVSNPLGLGTDGTRIWLAERGNNRICRFESDGTRTKAFTVSGCMDVAVDNNGLFYVTEVRGTTHEVQVFDTATDTLVYSWTAIPNSSTPAGISIDTVNNYVFVAGQTAQRVYRYNLNGTGGMEIGSGPGTADGFFSGPTGVAVIGSHNLVVVADRNNNRIQLLGAIDGISAKVINTDMSNLLLPEGAAVDKNGYLYVTSVALNVVKKFTSSGVYLATIGSAGSGLGQFSNPRAVEVDDSGNVYVAEFGNARVQRMSKITETTYEYAWSYAMDNPAGMDFGPDGNLYIAGSTTRSVVILTPGGTLVHVITQTDMEKNPGGVQVKLSTPASVAVDYQSNIYLADFGNGDIFKGTILNGLNQPSSYSWARIVNTSWQLRDIAVDKFGYLYVAVSSTNNVYVYASDGSPVDSWGSSGRADGQFNQPCGLALTPNEQALWVADRNNDRVQKFAISYEHAASELVTIGDPTGPPYVSGVSFLRTATDSTLTGPLSTIYNSAQGDSGVTFVVTFNEAMDTTSDSVPVVTLVDANNNQYAVDQRAGSNFVNGWLKTASNVWHGWANIPSGHDGLATIYVENAHDDAGSLQEPNPAAGGTVQLDTRSATPAITLPAGNSNTMEAMVPVSGTAEPFSRLSVTIYSASSGGTVVSQESGVEANASGNWSTGTMYLKIGDNFIAAVATDPAGNVSAATNPRSKVTRNNLSPGAIAVTPATDVMLGDSGRWEFTYTAAATLDDNAQVRIFIPGGWSRPQLNNPSLPGFVSVVAGAGATLDEVPLQIVNIDTVRVNIASMTNGNTFTLLYGGATAVAYAKVTANAKCGINTFSTMLNDSITVNPVSVTVVGNPVGAQYTTLIPALLSVGQSAVQAMRLTFGNESGLHNVKINQLSLAVQRDAGVGVGANSRLTALRVTRNGVVLGSASPAASSSVTLNLTSALEIAAGAKDSVVVEFDAVNNALMADSILVLAVLDSERVSAVDALSNSSVLVTSAGGDVFPYASAQAAFNVPSPPDSLVVKSIDLMPGGLIGELEKNVPGLRLLLTHQTPDGDAIEVTRIECDNPAIPNAVIAKKILRRKGASTNLFSSTAIEFSGPLVFNLSLSPIVVAAGTTDTVDILFDVVGAPTSTAIRFSITQENDIIARQAGNKAVVAVKGDPLSSFPLASTEGSIAVGTGTPSGKDIDATVADWNTDAEQLDTDTQGDQFYVSWDNSNLYIFWNNRNLETDGDLFIYLNKASGSSATATWNYSGYGTHFLPAGFGGADYCVYVEDASTYGIRSGASNYSAASFTGEVSRNGDATEIRIPFSDLGNPDSLKIIPFVQSEGSANIVMSLPNQGVGEFVRNPIGDAPQTFLSWFKFTSFESAQVPTEVVKLDSGFVVTPDWVYSVGPDNYVASVSAGKECLYLSVGGANPRIVRIDTEGRFQWEHLCSATPSTVGVLLDKTLSKRVLFFGDGTFFRTGVDDITSLNMSQYGSYNIGSTLGNPSRSFPPDGVGFGNNGIDPVFAYFSAGDGKVHKVNIYDPASGPVWSTPVIGATAGADVYNEFDRVYASCSDGYVRLYNINGVQQNARDVGPAINNKLWYNGPQNTIFVTPNDNNVVALSSNLAQTRWSVDLGATTTSAPYLLQDGSSTFKLYCPAGNYMRLITGDTLSASIGWTYQTTSQITTEPSERKGYVYFSSNDKRNFSISGTTGVNRSGWPTAVLAGENQSRVFAIQTFNAVYFGGGLGKLYKYQTP